MDAVKHLHVVTPLPPIVVADEIYPYLVVDSYPDLVAVVAVAEWRKAIVVAMQAMTPVVDAMRQSPAVVAMVATAVATAVAVVDCWRATATEHATYLVACFGDIVAAPVVC